MFSLLGVCVVGDDGSGGAEGVQLMFVFLVKNGGIRDLGDVGGYSCISVKMSCQQ